MAEGGGLCVVPFRKPHGLAVLLRAFEDPSVIQLQGENVELQLPTGKRQQRSEPEVLANSGNGLTDEMARAEYFADVRRAQENERRRLLR